MSMKKRIGTKVYNTKTAELIQDNEMGKLYRKRTRDHEWFAVVGGIIMPLSDAEGRAWIGEQAYSPKTPDTKSTGIRIDWETHDKIAAAAKKQGCTISEMIRLMAENL